MTKKALILGGGAPNATFMAGGVHTLLEKGVKFDVISTSGAGVLIGLLATAPKNGDPLAALAATPNMGVDDLIFSMLPVNYKVFKKPIPSGEEYYGTAQKWLNANPFYTANPQTEMERLTNDWLELMLATFTPSTLNPQSKGMAENVPFIEEYVDFEALCQIEPEFYINAYRIGSADKAGKIISFSKEEITGDHVRASVAFPFVYPPFPLEGKSYYEGAAVDSLNYKSLVKQRHPDLETLVVFDIIGADQLIREPRNLWDAYIISIITPLVEIAKDDTKLFQAFHNPIIEIHPEDRQKIEALPFNEQFAAWQELNWENAKYGDTPGAPRQWHSDQVKRKWKLLRVPFEVPAEHWPHVLDWSYSNLSTLFEIGKEAGERFYEQHQDDLT
jgi:predicted acylesterase/phospholipase RssA